MLNPLPLTINDKPLKKFNYIELLCLSFESQFLDTSYQVSSKTFKYYTYVLKYFVLQISCNNDKLTAQEI